MPKNSHGRSAKTAAAVWEDLQSLPKDERNRFGNMLLMDETSPVRRLFLHLSEMASLALKKMTADLERTKDKLSRTDMENVRLAREIIHRYRRGEGTLKELAERSIFGDYERFSKYRRRYRAMGLIPEDNPDN